MILLQSILGNLWSDISSCQLTHIVEASDWAIKNVGKSVTSSMNRQKLLRSHLSTSHIGLRNQLLHFDSVNTFFRKGSVVKPHRSNKIILTWFHVEPDDQRLALIKNEQQNIQFIHTSCTSTKEILITAGINPNKIVVIPLGVDTSLFIPATKEQKQALRERLGIAPDRMVIGSFQKDGVGWGQGLEPKLIKGPDVFVRAVARLKHHNPIILLTGPARGYIKRELEKNGIEYKHINLKSFDELPRMYHALDLYLITSRIEGGPLSLLEAWASGVPVVSTRVGMVPDIARDNETALLADVEDVTGLAKLVERLHVDPILAEQLSEQARSEVTNYSWDNIAKEYFEKLYRSLL